MNNACTWQKPGVKPTWSSAVVIFEGAMKTPSSSTTQSMMPSSTPSTTRVTRACAVRGEPCPIISKNECTWSPSAKGSRPGFKSVLPVECQEPLQACPHLGQKVLFNALPLVLSHLLEVACHPRREDGATASGCLRECLGGPPGQAEVVADHRAEDVEDVHRAVLTGERYCKRFRGERGK